MKLLDQYILRRLLVPFFYCLATFSMVFIIADLFEHLSDFIDARTPISEVIYYYSGILPASLTFTVPVTTLLAILYSLWQLTRRNELTAMRASGISYLRIIAPIMSVAAAASFSVWAVNEYVAPGRIFESARFIQRQRGDTGDNDRFITDLSYKNEAFHRIWTIGSFDIKSSAMERVKVTQEGPDGSEIETIHANSAEWMDGYWLFVGVTIQQYNTARQVKNITTHALFPARFFRETPRDFQDEVMLKFFDNNKEPAIFAGSDLRRILAGRIHMTGQERRFYMVELHSRLALAWAAFIVSIFAIPCGIQTGRRGALFGIIAALLTFFGFYVFFTLATWMGKQGHLSAITAAWLPNCIVFCLGLVFLKRL